MSGGSFNYLYCKTLSETMASFYDLKQMVETLEAEFPHSAAAIDTRRIYDVLDQMIREWDAPDSEVQRLAHVWQVIEWWQSNDYGFDSAEKAVREYKPVGQRTVVYVPMVCPVCMHKVNVAEDPQGQWFLEDHPVAGYDYAPLCAGSGKPLSRKSSGQWQ